MSEIFIMTNKMCIVFVICYFERDIYMWSAEITLYHVSLDTI